MSPNDRSILEAITAVGWYPVEPVLNFHRVFDNTYGNGDKTLCERMGQFSAEWSVNTIFKIIMKFKSPTWVLEKNQLVWRRFHDSGRWEISEIDKGVAIGKLLNFDVADEHFCARLRGWIRGIVSVTGGNDVKVEETKCKAKGASHCEFKMNWR